MVFVLDKNNEPLDPCHPARARRLLKNGRAVVAKCFPFTIRLLDRSIQESVIHAHRLKIDPGSKATGLAIVSEPDAKVVWLAQIHHRGAQVKKALFNRAALRRNRRARKTRYRAARYRNRRRKEGWLPPSLQSRVDNIVSWVRRLRKLCLLSFISQELVKFDTQLLQNAEISGLEYQRGELAGLEVWEYLLEKFGHRCVYCGATDCPLEKDHVLPRSRGGSDRVSNLVPSCRDCNQAKGSRTASEYGHAEVEIQAKKPLKDAAAVNATRWALYRGLNALGLSVETGTGGRTKFNRNKLGLSKEHYWDAVSVGASTAAELRISADRVLDITAGGRGSYSRTRSDQYGFPRLHLTRQKRHFGFASGDMVRAIVPKGKKAGKYEGRVAIRASGSFDLKTKEGLVSGISYRYCRLIARTDGYSYQILPIPIKKEEREGVALPPQA